MMWIIALLLVVVGLLAWHVKETGWQATWSATSALVAAVVAAIVAFAQSYNVH